MWRCRMADNNVSKSLGLTWTNRVKFAFHEEGGGSLSDVGKAHARDVGKTKTVKAWSLLNLFGIFSLLGCRATFYVHLELPPIGV